MFETLKEWDTKLFLFLNSKHNSFFDRIMYWASDKLFWMPFYLILLIVLVMYCKRESNLILMHVAALIAASDQLASGLLQNWVKRLRPSHELSIQNLIHLSKVGRGEEYGFVSSHASNAFALFIFLSLVLPASWRLLKYILLVCVLLVCYSGIYNGFYYPGDVIAGATLGSVMAWLFSRLYFTTIAKATTQMASANL